jgi:hypothetical protein
MTITVRILSERAIRWKEVKQVLVDPVYAKPQIWIQHDQRLVKKTVCHQERKEVHALE